MKGDVWIQATSCNEWALEMTQYEGYEGGV
jgi:hypothetical protein